MNSYTLLKFAIPFILFNTIVILNSKEVGIFRYSSILTTLCSILLFFMPKNFAIIFGIILAFLVLIKLDFVKNKIMILKNYILDDTVHGYYLIFKLVNNIDIHFYSSMEEFNEIKKWYENSAQEHYSRNNISTSEGKYVNLDKSNIIEFSYSSISNKRKFINSIKYIFTNQAPGYITALTYIKFIIFTSMIYSTFTIFNMSKLNYSFYYIISNPEIINSIIHKATLISTLVFIYFYAFYFLIKFIEVLKQDYSIYYKVQHQKSRKLTTYASVNLLIIFFLSFGLLSTTYF